MPVARLVRHRRRKCECTRRHALVMDPCLPFALLPLSARGSTQSALNCTSSKPPHLPVHPQAVASSDPMPLGRPGRAAGGIPTALHVGGRPHPHNQLFALTVVGGG